MLQQHHWDKDKAAYALNSPLIYWKENIYFYEYVVCCRKGNPDASMPIQLSTRGLGPSCSGRVSTYASLKELSARYYMYVLSLASVITELMIINKVLCLLYESNDTSVSASTSLLDIRKLNSLYVSFHPNLCTHKKQKSSQRKCL